MKKIVDLLKEQEMTLKDIVAHSEIGDINNRLNAILNEFDGAMTSIISFKGQQSDVEKAVSERYDETLTAFKNAKTDALMMIMEKVK